MRQKEFRVKSGLRKGDFRRLAYWNMFLKDSRMLIAFIGMFIIGIAGILITGKVLVLFLISTILTLCPVIVLAMMELNILKVQRGGALERRANADYKIDDRGIAAQGEHEERASFYSWDNLHRVYENKRFFIFFINQIEMLTIAKQDLKEEQAEALRLHLKEKLPKEKVAVQIP